MGIASWWERSMVEPNSEKTAVLLVRLGVVMDVVIARSAYAKY